MTFPERVTYQQAILMYKIMHNLSPPYLSSLFKFSKEVHDQTLRSTSENRLYVPKPNFKLYRNSLAFSGSKKLNSIPDRLRSATSLQHFSSGYLDLIANTLGVELFCLFVFLYVCIFMCTCL